MFWKYCIFAKFCSAVSEVTVRRLKPLPQLEEVRVVAPSIRSVQEIQWGTIELQNCKNILREKDTNFLSTEQAQKSVFITKKMPACLLLGLINCIKNIF